MSEMLPDGKPVVVARFLTVEEAHMAASRLAAEGIEAEVEPFHAFDVLTGSQYIVSPGGIGVLVPADQAETARQVLAVVRAEVAAMPPDEEGASEEEMADEPEELLEDEPPPVPEPLEKSLSALVLAMASFVLPVAPWALVNALWIRRTVMAQAETLNPSERSRCRRRMAWAIGVSIVAVIWYAFVVLVITVGPPGKFHI